MARVFHWRQFTVDVLTGAAAAALALGATSLTPDLPYLLLLTGGLVGIGLLLEPDTTGLPVGPRDAHRPSATPPQPA